MYTDMAFNPDLYETHYGFDTLDLAHNLFPELLYDDTAFPSEMLRWMRRRLATRMPAQYARQKALYDIYQADRRRREMAEWRETEEMPGLVQASTAVRGGSDRSPPAQTGIAVEATAEPDSIYITSSSRRAAHPSTVAFHQQAQAHRSTIAVQAPMPLAPTHMFFDESYNNILGSRGQVAGPIDQFMNTLFPQQRNPNPLLNLLLNPSIWNDVAVVATNDQIDAGSTLREASSIRAEEVCSICQEHDIVEGVDAQWRELHCSHTFHRACVDRWFESHVACPVCRADVRTTTRPV